MTATKKSIEKLFNQTIEKNGETLPKFKHHDIKRNIAVNLLKTDDINTLLLIAALVKAV